MSTAEETLRTEARESLLRMQEFKVETLPQTERLGNALHFADAPLPAERIIKLYRLISVNILDELPASFLEQIKRRANEDFSRLNSILSFEPNRNNPGSMRDQLLAELSANYQPAFDALQGLISYSASRSTDFKGLESTARAAAQAMQDQATTLMKDLRSTQESAASVLAEIRKVAAEQGVSQQAIHFANEATSHDVQANFWLNRTAWAAGTLLFWAIVSLVLHKCPFLSPGSTYESVHLAMSKVLIFGVMSFATYLCARNFLSHKHNSIVNKHRQNALATYRAIVEASNGQANSDIILSQAAACIFSPQSTGYTTGKPVDGATAKSVVEFLGKPFSAGE